MKNLKAVQVSRKVQDEPSVHWNYQIFVVFLLVWFHNEKDTEILEKSAKRLAKEGRTDDALKKYYEIMRIFEAEMVPPFQDYCKCQQAIKECLLEYGNKIQIEWMHLQQ